MPKKRHLGSQNGCGSSGPEKLPKIVNCATIKETEKLKETMVGVQVEFFLHFSRIRPLVYPHMKFISSL